MTGHGHRPRLDHMVGAASLRAEHCTTWVLETSRLSPRPRPMTDRGRNLNVCATTRGSRNIGCRPVRAHWRHLSMPTGRHGTQPSKSPSALSARRCVRMCSALQILPRGVRRRAWWLTSRSSNRHGAPMSMPSFMTGRCSRTPLTPIRIAQARRSSSSTGVGSSGCPHKNIGKSLTVWL